MENTERRNDIIRFIVDYRAKNSYPPSIREIMVGVGIASLSTLYGYMERMTRDGYITMEKGKTRSIDVTGMGRRAVGIPETTDAEKLRNMVAMLLKENHELRKAVRGNGN